VPRTLYAVSDITAHCSVWTLVHHRAYPLPDLSEAMMKTRIAEPPTEDTVQFTLRMPTELVNELRRIASREERSPSAEIRLLVRRHVEASLKEAA
jgi:hypothetical protein